MSTDTTPPPSPPRFATIFLVVTLGLQCVAGFKLLSPPRHLQALQPLRIAPAPTLWPFLDYNMYDVSHDSGKVVGRSFLFAVPAAGPPVRLTEGDFDVDYRTFRDEILWPLRDAAQSDAVSIAQAAAARLEQLGRDRPLWFRIENHPLITSKNGVEEGPTRFMRRISCEPGR